jgi:hypothetical protein
VGYTLKKKDRIIAKIKTKYWTTTVKYGIRLPHSVKEALAIDAETDTDLWYRAIAKEGYKSVPCVFKQTRAFEGGITRGII